MAEECLSGEQKTKVLQNIDDIITTLKIQRRLLDTEEKMDQKLQEDGISSDEPVDYDDERSSIDGRIEDLKALKEKVQKDVEVCPADGVESGTPAS